MGIVEDGTLGYTLPEGLGVLGDEPVARLDIRDLCIGEELLDRGNSVVRYISRLGTPDEQCGTVILDTI